MTLGVMFFEAGLVASWDILVTIKEKGLEHWYDWRDRAEDHPASWK